jgi:hypothetical protein
VEAHEPEHPLRSIEAQQGRSAGPLTKEAALRLVDAVINSPRETAKYRDAVEQLRRAWVLDEESPSVLGVPVGPPPECLPPALG